MIQFNYTITQAAAILNRSPKSVRSLIDAGKLQATDVGSGTKRKHYTVPPDAIEAFRKASEAEKVATRDRVIQRFDVPLLSTNESFSRYPRTAPRGRCR